MVFVRNQFKTRQEVLTECGQAIKQLAETLADRPPDIHWTVKEDEVHQLAGWTIDTNPYWGVLQDGSVFEFGEMVITRRFTGRELVAFDGVFRLELEKLGTTDIIELHQKVARAHYRLHGASVRAVLNIS